MERERIYIHEDIVMKVYEYRRDYVTFIDLDPKSWELSKTSLKYYKLKRRPCIDLIIKFNVCSLVQTIKLLHQPVGSVIGVDTNSRTSLVEIGSAQLNVVEDYVLVWECYVYEFYRNYAKKVIIALEHFLRDNYPEVRKIYINGYEPSYPNEYEHYLKELGYELVREVDSVTKVYVKSL